MTYSPVRHRYMRHTSHEQTAASAAPSQPPVAAIMTPTRAAMASTSAAIPTKKSIIGAPNG